MWLRRAESLRRKGHEEVSSETTEFHRCTNASRYVVKATVNVFAEKYRGRYRAQLVVYINFVAQK